MDDGDDGVDRHHGFRGGDALRFGELDLARLDFPRGIRDVGRFVDQGLDAVAGATPRQGDVDARVRLHVGLQGNLGDRQDRRRSLDDDVFRQGRPGAEKQSERHRRQFFQNAVHLVFLLFFF